MTRPILYSKPNCGQCIMTQKVLNRDGVEYDTIDITEDPAALEFIKGLGYMQAPVMYVNPTNHWAGFIPAKLASLKTKAA